MEEHLGDFYRKMGFKNDLIIRPLHGIYSETEAADGDVKHGSIKMVCAGTGVLILIVPISTGQSTSTAGYETSRK